MLQRWMTDQPGVAETIDTWLLMARRCRLDRCKGHWCSANYRPGKPVSDSIGVAVAKGTDDSDASNEICALRGEADRTLWVVCQGALHASLTQINLEQRDADFM